MSTCKTTHAKLALTMALGKKSTEVSTRRVHAYVFKAAENKFGDRMDACMEAAGTNSTRMVKCKSTMKEMVATYLGRTTKVSSVTVAKYSRRAAFMKLPEAMTGCMSAAG